MEKLIVLLCLLHVSYGVIYKLNVSEYNKMPALYGLDDYEACMSEPGGTYCVMDVDLHTGANAELMKMIKGYSDHKLKHYNHSQIHRGVCVSQICKDFAKVPMGNDTEDLKYNLEGCLNHSLYSQYKLEGSLAKIQYCNSEGDSVIIDTSDIVMAVVYVVLILLNTVGSFYDILLFKKEDKTGNPYLMAFSVRRNWMKLVAPSSVGPDPRLERLKQFHGLRTMTMICVLFSHTVLVMAFSYIDNPLYVETSYEDPVKQLLFNGTLVTHTFFVMSSFLLAYNFEIHTEKHPARWMDFPKGVILRWLRLTPTYALVMFSIATWMRHAFKGPLWGLIVTSEAVACRQYWWAQLLYINNYIYEDAYCMPQTWYLAADTQLFCIGLFVCVIARKLKTRTILLSILFVISLVVVAVQTYFLDLDAVVMQRPETYRNVYATDDTFRLIFIRFHPNMCTYIIGLMGGFLAYRWQTNGKNIDKYKKFRWVMWLMFPLGVAVILSGGLFYSDSGRAPTILRVVYATFCKPVFQMIVVTLIMGFTFKIETVYRGIIEWRGWTWTGRVTYSAYLLHTVFQRGLAGMQTQLIHMSDYYVMVLLAGSLFLTYLCGAILWVCVEAPVAGLVKAALTPPKRKVRETEEEGDTTKV